MAVDKRWKIPCLSGLVCFSLTANALGQLATPGQNALDAASGGAVRSRAPGNMVSAGVAAALTAADVARGGVEIVETTRPPSLLTRLLLDPKGDLLATISTQLNRILGCLGSRLLARAGLISSVADLCSASNGNTGGDGNSGGSSGGTSGGGRR